MEEEGDIPAAKYAMLHKRYNNETIETEIAPCRFSVGIGFLISFTTEKALAYPEYAKMILTRATDRSFPLFVVPSNALRKLAPGSGIRETCPPRTTKPVMLMLQQL